jgi:hypothetical protein
VSTFEVVLRMIVGLGLIALGVWIAVAYARFEARTYRRYRNSRRKP